MPSKKVHPGLVGVVADESAVSVVDGERSTLVYRGYTIEDLAEHATFDEVAWLTWFGRLPTAEELDETSRQIASHRWVSAELQDILGHLPPTSPPMSVLRTAVSMMGVWDPRAESESGHLNQDIAIELCARLPSVVAVFHRQRTGQPVVPPDPGMSQAGNFLYMLQGKRPSDMFEHIFDIHPGVGLVRFEKMHLAHLPGLESLVREFRKFPQVAGRHLGIERRLARRGVVRVQLIARGRVERVHDFRPALAVQPRDFQPQFIVELQAHVRVVQVYAFFHAQYFDGAVLLLLANFHYLLRLHLWINRTQVIVRADHVSHFRALRRPKRNRAAAIKIRVVRVRRHDHDSFDFHSTCPFRAMLSLS